MESPAGSGEQYGRDRDQWPVPAFNQSDEAAAPVQGGGAFGAIGANIAFSLLMLIMLWMPMACLCPLTSTAGVVAEVRMFATK